MNCAANTAFANRQVITHQIRRAFESVFGQSAETLAWSWCMMSRITLPRSSGIRKGTSWYTEKAPRARTWAPGPSARYDSIGQPVICGGSMETGSYLLVGTARAGQGTFASTMHGSGRTMSRGQAKRSVRGEDLQRQMKQRGIVVKAVSMSGLAAGKVGFAYKHISDVVETVERAGMAKKVAELSTDWQYKRLTL